jgi:hypothetical protein
MPPLSVPTACPAGKHQAADEGHAAGLVDQHQITGGVAAVLTQLEFTLADAQRAGAAGLGGQARLGALHPVAAHA